MTGDGASDVVGQFSDGRLVWWENPVDRDWPGSWDQHYLDTCVRPVQAGKLIGDLDKDGKNDIDHDGDLDILFMSESAVRVLKNNLSPGTVAFLEKRVIASDFDQSNDVHIGDFDRDNDLDVAAAAWWDDAVRLWNNDGADVPSWTVEPVDNEVDAVQSLAVADLDGDQWPDLLGATGSLNSVRWWSNNNGAWNDEVIEEIEASRDIVAADLDGDRDLDVVAATEDDELMLWYNDGTPEDGGWLVESITPPATLGGVWDVAAGDLDGDGDIDLVASAEADGVIKWYENTELLGARVMLPHDLADAITGIKGLYLADLDGDNDLDLVGAVSGLDLIMWWENTRGDPIYWETHFIGSGFEGAIDVVAHDMDGDLDLDVIGAAQTAGTIKWWENTAGDAIHWEEHPVTTGLFADVRAIAIADIDHNAAPDIVAVAGRPTNEVAWWPSRPQPWRGAVVPGIQRLLLPGVATHIFGVEVDNSGEPSEPALIVDTWQLRLQRSGGQALTGSELDQLVESLGVYEDDGDGAFGPEDNLVFEESDLPISPDGVVMVQPPPADPPLSVVPGEFFRFFLVLTPAPEAHQSGLDELTLTPVRDLLVHPAGSDTAVPLADGLAGASLTMSVRESAPDFSPHTLVAPSEGVTEHGYTVSWTTLDPGEPAAWIDAIYLSRDPCHHEGDDDHPIGRTTWTTALAQQASFTKEKILAMPSVPPGDYYIVLNLDDMNNLEDADLTNNQLAVPIRVRTPDLIPGNLQVPTEWDSGQQVRIDWVVENIGDGEALRWRDDLWLSPEPDLEAAMIHLDYRSSGPTLAVGAIEDAGLTVTVPAVPQGLYYFILENNRYGWVYERSGWDQDLVVPVIIRNPDLKVSNFNAPNAVVPGARIDFEWTVTNQGLGAGGFALDGVYFSTDSELDAGDELLTWKITPSLDPDGSYTFGGYREHLPTSVPGSYFLLVNVDYQSDIFESNESNNLVAYPIDIVEPGTIRSVSSLEYLPGSSQLCLILPSVLGQSYQVESTVDLINGPWVPDTVFLSPDDPQGLTEIDGTGVALPVYVDISISESRRFLRVRLTE